MIPLSLNNFTNQSVSTGKPSFSMSLNEMKSRLANAPRFRWNLRESAYPTPRLLMSYPYYPWKKPSNSFFISNASCLLPLKELL